MTIERRRSEVGHSRCAARLRSVSGSPDLAIAALTLEPTQEVVVVAADRNAAIASIARADVALVHASDTVITVAGRSRGFVRDLYAGGAWLVLPASNGGCRGRPSGRAGLMG